MTDVNFKPGFTPPASHIDAYWYLIDPQQNLLLHQSDDAPIPFGPKPPIVTSDPHYLGQYQSHPCFVAQLTPSQSIPDQYHKVHLRAAHPQLNASHWSIASMAAHFIYWDSTTQYCGRCGHHPLVPSPDERAKICQQCDYHIYPQICPAIIIRIERGDELLLAENVRYRGNLLSLIAGFVEIGETAEACIQREVMEEVGIAVHEIRYIASQPWPFPNSLMLGFSAQYLSGEIKVDNVEIIQAKWFHKTALPAIPGSPSIARRLIDDFVNAPLKAAGSSDH